MMIDEKKRQEAVRLAEQAFETEAECLRRQKEVLSGEIITRAAEILCEADAIASSACGHSGIACRHFAHLMCCIGKTARFLSPSEAVHGGMGFLHPGSVMLLASRGGKTSELIPILRYCQNGSVRVITVTENMESELAKGADFVIPMLVNRETDRYNCQGTTSFIITSAIFDAIQTAMIELSGFHNEQFAGVHPGGAVGERLNGGIK